MDVTRSESAQPDSNLPVSSTTLVITQTNADVRVETLREGKRQYAKYPLDQTENPQPVGVVVFSS